MTARCSSGQIDSQAITYFNACFAALQSSLGTNTTWAGVQVALQGSDVFNPIAGWTPVSGSGAIVQPVDTPRALSFVGRTSNGRKSRVFVFGVTSSFVTPPTYEQDPLTTAGFQGFQGLLNSQNDFWLGIDGVKPVWYFRVNVKTNDHYVDLKRQ
jgi:hypothetical protein